MRLRILTILLLAALPWLGHAQEPATETVTAAKCLSSAPDRVLPLIQKNTRLDMLDYFQAGMDTPSTNDYGDQCRITSLSDVSVMIEAAPGVAYQLFVLDPDQQPVIGVIETIDTPLPDSKITLYDTQWTPLGINAFAAPRLADWLAPKTKDRRQIEEELPFVMASYAYDPASGTLVVTNNMSQYYAAGEQPQWLSQLKPSITYAWTGRQFRPAK